MAKQISFKQLAINKDNATIVLAVGLAAFVVVFSLVASNALLKQRGYQAKVIGKKKVALNQLKINVSEVDKLRTSYQVFAEAEQNVLGGSSKGTGDRDGENPRLVLDALPSKYDFPSLATSLEKVFKSYKLESITGTDDEITQSELASSGTPQPIEIPFAISVTGSVQASDQMLEIFEQSIRPFQIVGLTLAVPGKTDELTITADAKTYFQPQQKLEIKTEKVK